MSRKNLDIFRLEDRILFEAAAAAEIAAAENLSSANEAEQQEQEEKDELKNAPVDQNGSTAQTAPSAEQQKTPEELAETEVQAIIEGEITSGDDVQGGSSLADQVLEQPDSDEIPAGDALNYVDSMTAEDTVDLVVRQTSQTYSTSRELVIINSGSQDSDSALSLSPVQDVLLLQDGQDGMAQISAYLDTHSDVKYNAIHFLTHGNKGYFVMGGKEYTANNFRAEDWQNIGEHLTEDGDILFYGCDLAGNENGKELVSMIAEASGADTAASVDTTGIGGNWTLEYTFGEVETESLALDGFRWNLQTVGIQKNLTIVADNAAKVYDGIALTASGYSFSYGGGQEEVRTGVSGEYVQLDDLGHYLVVTIEGSQTDVGGGVGNNKITSYKIIHRDGDVETDVTAESAEAFLKDGTLAVTQRRVTLNSLSATDVYTGQALTNHTISISGEGFAEGEGAIYDFTGSQTDAGFSDNTFTYRLDENTKASNYIITTHTGTLTVTRKNLVILFSVQDKVYDGTTTAAQKGDLIYAGLVKGDQVYLDASKLTFSFEDKNVGKNKTVTAEGYAAYDLTGEDVGNYAITFTDTAKADITPAALALTGKTRNVIYDSTSHSISSYESAFGLTEADADASISVDGSANGVNAGSYSYALSNGRITGAGGEDLTGNYAITYGTGLLNIEKREITITADSATKSYDGTELTANGYKITEGSFVADDGFDAVTVAGSQLLAGTSANKITSYTLNSNTEAGNYEITTVDGTLEVTNTEKISLTIMADSNAKLYDGTALKADGYTYFGTLAHGDVLTVTVSGSQTNAGESENVIASYKIMHGDADVTSYYEVDTINGKLTVAKRSLTLTSASQTKVYDGTALTDSLVTVGGDGFVEGEGATYTVTGSQTDAGSSDNTFTYQLNSNTDAGNYNIAIAKGTLTVTQKNLEISFAANDKVYDGTTAATQNGNFIYTGLIAGDEVVLAKDGMTFAFDTKNAGTDKTVTATGYTSDSVTGEDVGNYNITFTDTAIADVTRATLSLTGKTESTIYDGADHTVSGYDTVSGLVAADASATISVDGSATGKNAGTYSYTLSNGKVTGAGGEDLTNNYTITYGTGKLDIAKREITITADSATKTYDGTALTANSYKITEGSFVASEGFEAVTIVGSQLFAGTSANKITGYTLNSNTNAGNYEITTVDGTLEVTNTEKISLIITADDGAKLYDGTALTANGYTYVGDLATGDTLTVTVSGSQTNAGEAANVVASYKIMHGDTDVTSYYEVDTINGTLSVAKRSLTLTSASQTKVYDGTALTDSLVTVGGDGFVEGEGATYTVTGSQTDAGSSDNTFTYQLNSNTDAGNYKIAIAKGTLTVTQKNLEISFAANDKVYDGTTAATQDGDFIYTGLIAGDEVVLSKGGMTFAFDTKNAGTDKTVTATGYTSDSVTGEDVGNYNITFTDTAKADVTRAELSLTGKTESTIYDGADHTVSGYDTVSGLVAADASATISVDGSATGKNAGTYSYTLSNGKITGAGGEDLTNNYTITYGTGKLDIAKREITITADSATKTYDGTELTANSYKITEGSFVASEGFEAVTIVGSQLFAGTSANKITGYTLNSNTNAGNYEITTVDGTLEVTNTEKISLIITADSGAKLYDGTALTANGYTYVGDLATGDTLTVTVSGSQTNAGEAANVVASYKIMHGDTDVTSYYEVDTINGTLSVAKRSLTLTSASQTKVYDGTALTDSLVTVGGDGFVEGEGATYTVIGSQTDAGSSDNTFTYQLNSNTDAGNYNITIAKGTLTVTQKNLEISFAANDKVYDGTTAATQDGNFIYTGLIAGDEVVLAKDGMTFAFDTKNAGTDKTVTATGYTSDAVTGADVGNYNITFANTAKADITPRNIIVTVDAEKVYDGSAELDLAEDSYTLSVSESAAGLIGSDDFTLEKFTFANKNAGTFNSTADSTGGTVTFNDALDAQNFAAEFRYTGEITKLALEITAGSAEKVYDGTPLTTDVWSITGDNQFVDGEDFASVTVSGSQKNVGSSASAISAYTFNEKTEAGNYEITFKDGTLTVTPREIVLDPDDQTIDYGDTPETKYEFVDDCGNTVTVTTTTTGPESTGGYLTVDGDHVITITDVKITDPDGNDVSGNYDIDDSGTGKVTVLPADIVIQRDGIDKTYDATVNGDYTYTITGGMSGDVLEYVKGDAVFADPNAGTDKPLTITGDQTVGNDWKNYNVTYTDTPADIRKAVLVFETDPKTKYYGQPDPALTYTILSGQLFGSDSISHITRQPGENPGAYAIDGYRLNDGNDGNNYDVRFRANDLLIIQNSHNVYMDSSTFEYDVNGEPSRVRMTGALRDREQRRDYKEILTGYPELERIPYLELSQAMRSSEKMPFEELTQQFHETVPQSERDLFAPDIEADADRRFNKRSEFKDEFELALEDMLVL